MLTETVFAERVDKVIDLCSVLNVGGDFLCRDTPCEHCPVEVKLHKAIEVIHPITEPLRGLREENSKEIEYEW